MYHRILPNNSGLVKDPYAVKEENFRKQLQMIDALNFTPVTFEDYQLYLEDKLTLPKKPVIITFDDGHLDTYKTALPILRDFNMRAVIYAVGDRSLKSAFWDQKTKEDRLPLMTDQQILEARADGFEIGAHSMTHPVLPALPEEEQVEEILGSKQSLEDLLGERLLSFAYPYGSLNKSTYEITIKAGFKFACGVYSGPARFGDDLFNIRRMAVGYNTGMFLFLMKLATPYEYFDWMKYRLRNKSNEVGKTATELDIPNVDYETSLKNNLEAK